MLCLQAPVPGMGAVAPAVQEPEPPNTEAALRSLYYVMQSVEVGLQGLQQLGTVLR